MTIIKKLFLTCGNGSHFKDRFVGIWFILPTSIKCSFSFLRTMTITFHDHELMWGNNIIQCDTLD